MLCTRPTWRCCTIGLDVLGAIGAPKFANGLEDGPLMATGSNASSCLREVDKSGARDSVREARGLSEWKRAETQQKFLSLCER